MHMQTNKKMSTTKIAHNSCILMLQVNFCPHMLVYQWVAKRVPNTICSKYTMIIHTLYKVTIGCWQFPCVNLYFINFVVFRLSFAANDHSGFRIHYSKHLRKHDGGVMISGVSVSDTQLIPPGQKLYRNVGICGPSCSNVVCCHLIIQWCGVCI